MDNKQKTLLMDIMNRESAILILVGLMEELGLLMAMAGDVKENMTSLMSREYNIKTSLAETLCHRSSFNP